MEDVFKKNGTHGSFTWANIGDIKLGRGNLGEEMPVLVYRLMQFTTFDILTREFGRDKANEILREAGNLAGKEFARNTMDLKVDMNTFIANLQNSLKDLKIGILRIETIDDEAQEIVLTVAEDLDCSGLPISNETVCDYDEGFIAGLLKEYTGKVYSVREIDCWANGDRVCRFKCVVAGKE